MDSATNADFYQLFSTETEYLQIFAVAALGYRNQGQGVAPDQSATFARQALKRLGAQSPLNALRVARLTDGL
jgi:hypothetical protein